MGAVHELRQTFNDLLGRSLFTFRGTGQGGEVDVIDTLQQDHPLDAAARQYVAIEAGQCTAANEMAQHAVAGDTHVDHAKARRCRAEGVGKLQAQLEPPTLLRTIMRTLWSTKVAGTGTTGEGGG